MRPALLGVLLLLSAPVGATRKHNGEMCPTWMTWTGSPVGVFQCPRASDQVDATFCCRTCRLPFCCSSAGLRLDQQHSTLDGQLEPMASNRQVGVTPRHPAYPKAQMHYVWYILIAVTAVCFFICLYLAFRILKDERRKKRQRMLTLQRIRNWLRDLSDAVPLELVPIPSEAAGINAPSSYASSELRHDLDNPPDVQFTPPTSRIPKDKEIILSPATLPTDVLDPTLEPTPEAESVF